MNFDLKEEKKQNFVRQITQGSGSDRYVGGPMPRADMTTPPMYNNPGQFGMPPNMSYFFILYNFRRYYIPKSNFYRDYYKITKLLIWGTLDNRRESSSYRAWEVKGKMGR